MYMEICEGKMPEALKNLSTTPKYTDDEGNPIIDDEGGAYIQPEPGFVIKTKDKAGEKVFVNIVQHKLVEGLQEQILTPEEARKLNSSDVGLRIPLSLGEVKEDRDKKGEPSQVYDFIFNPKTVKMA